MLFLSCSSSRTEKYLIDKVIIVKSWCRDPIDFKNDTGYANCPIIAVSVSSNLHYYCSKGSLETSKLICYNAPITETLWDFIYKTYVIKVLEDPHNWDFLDYDRGLENHTIVDLYSGPEYFIVCSKNNKDVKILNYRNPAYMCRHNSLFNFMVLLQKQLYPS